MVETRWLKASRAGFAALVLLYGGAALAKEPPGGASAPVLQAVIRCRGIAEDTARLACFDAAVGALTQAATSGDLVAVDREQRRAVRRQTFGFTLPALTIFDRGEPAAELNRMEVKIAAASQDGFGKWIVTLDDGAVWRQVDDNDIEPPPHSGSTAVISHGAMGSFFMKIDGRGFMRVRRDR